MAGPFDCLRVDIIQFPCSYDGNKYAIVFMDYLIKWPEVLPVPNQTAETIAQALVEVISRHGVPAKLLSDRGASFLSDILQEVYKLLGIKKVNTSAYHPQSDGLVERFNRTVTDMLAKTVDQSGRDWDKISYVLYAYRISVQESTKESPFSLLYDRDARLPTEAALTQPQTCYQVDIDDLKSCGRLLVCNFSEAWELARHNISQSQKKQKQHYDKGTRPKDYHVGDSVCAHAWGCSRQGLEICQTLPWPYRILELTPTNVSVRLIDKP